MMEEFLPQAVAGKRFELPSISTQCGFQPLAELPEDQAKKCAGRFFQRIDNSRAEVLLGFINARRDQAKQFEVLIFQSSRAKSRDPVAKS